MAGAARTLGGSGGPFRGPPMLLLIENDEAAVGAIDDGRSTARDQDRLLDGHAERAELVVWRLRAQHHAGLERLAAGPQPRRLDRLEADPVADVMATEFRQAAVAHGGDGGLEDLAAIDTRPNRLERGLHAGLDRVVRPQCA